MPPDFFNSREDAILLWLVAIVGFAAFKDPRGIATAVLSVVRALLHHKLLLLFGSALLYAVGVIYAASVVGLWHTTSLKETTFWFAGTGLVLVGEAVTHISDDETVLLRRVLKRIIAVTILVEFVGGLYALPLFFELVGVGILLVFSLMEAYLRHDAGADTHVRGFVRGTLIAAGLIYVLAFVVMAMGNPDRLVARESLEALLVGPALTLLLVPFLLGVAWISRREQENLRKRWLGARPT